MDYILTVVDGRGVGLRSDSMNGLRSVVDGLCSDCGGRTVFRLWWTDCVLTVMDGLCSDCDERTVL